MVEQRIEEVLLDHVLISFGVADRRRHSSSSPVDGGVRLSDDSALVRDNPDAALRAEGK
jgi:hypothetical protein